MPADLATTPGNRQLLLWMFSFLAPVRHRVMLACLLLTLWVGLEIIAVRQTAQAVNAIEHVRIGAGQTGASWWDWLAGGSDEARAIEGALLWLAVLSLSLAVVACVREVTNSGLSMRLVHHIREAVYDKLQRVGLRFHDQLSTGELINRALTDLQNVRQFVNASVLLVLEIVLFVGGYIVLLTTRSPWLVLLAVAPLPLWTVYILRFSRRVQPAQKAVLEAGDRNVSILTENISGVLVVKAFAAQPHEIEKYERNCDKFFEVVMRRIRLYANFTPTIRSISMASHLGLFLAAGLLIIDGQLRPGDVLMLGSAMGAILGRLQQVAVISEQYQSAIVSAQRLREVLSAAPTVAEPAAPRTLPPGPGAVRFENVTFGYDPARPVLHDVSFDAPGGAMVALVGPTGAGKSTLVQLLARLYDPQRGRVLVDGCDLRDVPLSAVRGQIAFVFQETFLFSDTIAANIAYGRAGWFEGEIEAAARLSQAHDFIDPLPSRYQTVLGERGQTLSGGQRQRLAIARAIHANPRILILDDATAAIDPQTEDLIHRGLRHVMHGRTLFVIAHRINTVKRADLVLVLERGRLVQAGTHAELMRTDGHYRDIAAVQLRDDDEPQAGPSPAESAASGGGGA